MQTNLFHSHKIQSYFLVIYDNETETYLSELHKLTLAKTSIKNKNQPIH